MLLQPYITHVLPFVVLYGIVSLKMHNVNGLKQTNKETKNFQ